MLITTIAIYASNPNNFTFVKYINPDFGGIIEFMEIYVIDEEQGVQINIIGAQQYENMAILYLSMQDISDQNRLTEHSMVFFDSSATSTSQRMIHFNKETNKAYFEIWLKDVTANYIELTGVDIVFEWGEYNVPIPLSLLDMVDAHTIFKPHMLFSTFGHEVGMHHRTLAPSGAGQFSDLPNAPHQWLSGIALINGYLHVQIGKPLTMHSIFESIGSVFLTTPEGDVQSIGCPSHYFLSFFTDENFEPLNPASFSNPEDWEKQIRYDFQEYIFSVNINELELYSLNFSGPLIAGVHLDLAMNIYTDDTSDQVRVWNGSALAFNGLLESITLSPLGVQVNGRGNEPHVNLI